jgi:uncharacterized membrane protein
VARTNEITKKTAVLAIVVICCNVGGNLLLSVGMHDVGATVSASPVPYLRALLNPWVITGIVLLAGWLFANLSLLSWADLSYVLPVTAVGYVLSALVGVLVLKEQVTAVRWTGVAMITAGAIVVGMTTPRTTPEGPQDFENGDEQ